MEVERQTDKFLNDPRLTLQSIEQEEEVKKFTGGECDFVSDVAVWYPLRVIMTVPGCRRKTNRSC